MNILQDLHRPRFSSEEAKVVRSNIYIAQKQNTNAMWRLKTDWHSKNGDRLGFQVLYIYMIYNRKSMGKNRTNREVSWKSGALTGP